MSCNICNKYRIGKIKTMKTTDLAKNALNTALTVGGAWGGREIRKMIPAETLDPMYTNALLVIGGGLLIPMLGKGKSAQYITPLGTGIAVEAGLQLIDSMSGSVSGYNNAGPGLYGYNNAGPGLYGTFAPDYSGTQQPVTSTGL